MVMDSSNYRDVVEQDHSGKGKEKVVMMTDYCSKFTQSKVPDPIMAGKRASN